MIDIITPFVALTQPEDFSFIVSLYVGVLLLWLLLFIFIIGVVLYK